MKAFRFIVAFVALMGSIASHAQGFKVYKGDFNIDNPASTVERIEFYPASEGSGSPGFRVYKKGGIIVDYPSNSIHHVDFYPLPVYSGEKKTIDDTAHQMVALLGDDMGEVSSALETFTSLTGYDVSELLGTVVQTLALKIEMGGENVVLSLSDFYGSFVTDGEKWVKSGESDKLVFTNVGADGNTYTAALSCSGDTKIFQIKDPDDNYSEEDQGINLELPEQIELKFNKQSVDVLTIIIEFDIKNLGTDLLKDGLLFNVSMILPKTSGGDFRLVMKNVGYTPGSGINIPFQMLSDQTVVVNGDITADVTKGVDEDGDTAMLIGPVNFTLDMLGQVLLKGTVKDIQSLIGHFLGKDYDDLKSDIKNNISSSVYMPGSSEPVATITIEDVMVSNGNGEHTSPQPVLHFNDGTTQTFMSFFSDPVYGPLVNIYIGVMEVFYKIYKNSKSVDDDDDSQEGDDPEDNVANKLWGTWSISYATGEKATVFFGKRGAYSYTYDGTTKTGSYKVNSYSHITASEWQTDSGWLGSASLDYNGKVEEQTFFISEDENTLSWRHQTWTRE